jgi:hypothetical protein
MPRKKLEFSSRFFHRKPKDPTVGIAIFDDTLLGESLYWEYTEDYPL